MRRVRKANPLSEKSRGAKYPQGRTDTLIGAGMRVEGNIAFMGVLQIQGDTLGEVSSDSDPNGTIVVGTSGSITGTLKAPHIVVSGRVSGPLRSSQSIEIRQGACVAGDAWYQALEIHAGGVIEGALTPVDAAHGERPQGEHEVQASAPPTVGARGTPDAGLGVRPRFGAGRLLGAALALLVALAAGVWVSRDPPPLVPATPTIAIEAGAATVGAATPAAAAAGDQPDDAKVVAGNVAAAMPAPEVNTGSAANAPSPGITEVDGDTLVTIQGVNPAKPAGVFLVIGKEAAVLFRKKRQDVTAGTRIDIAQGATESIAIARNEVFRVAQGRDLTIFYQGRKVPPKTIESGAWMSFVPQSSGAAAEKN